jgi:RNase_H superfamily
VRIGVNQMSDAKSVIVPAELNELVREAVGEPGKQSFSRNFQVIFEPSLPSRGDLTAAADSPGQASSGSGVLSPGLRAEDGLGVKRFIKADGVVWWCPGIAGPVLAFDIETTGLREADTVTCVCAYDPDRGVHFRESTPSGARSERFLALLDEAPLLCAFNGVRFDVPFLAKRWRIEAQRVGSWVKKLVDPYEACKLALQRTFSLDRLLHANGLDSKTGSGAEAVRMAREGRWRELEEYCMQDTILTHQILKLRCVVIPGPMQEKKYKLPGA